MAEVPKLKKSLSKYNTGTLTPPRTTSAQDLRQGGDSDEEYGKVVEDPELKRPMIKKTLSKYGVSPEIVQRITQTKSRDDDDDDDYGAPVKDPELVPIPSKLDQPIIRRSLSRYGSYVQKTAIENPREDSDDEYGGVETTFLEESKGPSSDVVGSNNSSTAVATSIPESSTSTTTETATTLSTILVPTAPTPAEPSPSSPSSSTAADAALEEDPEYSQLLQRGYKREQVLMILRRKKSKSSLSPTPSVQRMSPTPSTQTQAPVVSRADSFSEIKHVDEERETPTLDLAQLGQALPSSSSSVGTDAAIAARPKSLTPAQERAAQSLIQAGMSREEASLYVLSAVVSPTHSGGLARTRSMRNPNSSSSNNINNVSMHNMRSQQQQPVTDDTGVVVVDAAHAVLAPVPTTADPRVLPVATPSATTTTTTPASTSDANEEADVEARIQKLVAEQKAEFGVSMYDVLKMEDEGTLRRLLSEGHQPEVAMRLIFESKGYISQRNLAAHQHPHPPTQQPQHPQQPQPVQMQTAYVPAGAPPPQALYPVMTPYGLAYPAAAPPGYGYPGMPMPMPMQMQVPMQMNVPGAPLPPPHTVQAEAANGSLRKQSSRQGGHLGEGEGEAHAGRDSEVSDGNRDSYESHSHDGSDSQSDGEDYEDEGSQAPPAAQTELPQYTLSPKNADGTRGTHTGKDGNHNSSFSKVMRQKTMSKMKSFLGMAVADHHAKRDKHGKRKTHDERTMQKKLRYKDSDVEVIMKMGFTKEQAVQALFENNNKVDMAVNALLTDNDRRPSHVTTVRTNSTNQMMHPHHQHGMPMYAAAPPQMYAAPQYMAYAPAGMAAYPAPYGAPPPGAMMIPAGYAGAPAPAGVYPAQYYGYPGAQPMAMPQQPQAPQGYYTMSPPGSMHNVHAAAAPPAAAAAPGAAPYASPPPNGRR